MAAKTVDREALNAMGCDIPGCAHDHSILYLLAECHPKAGTRVKYVKADSLLIIQCSRCGKEVVRVKLD